jgi:hypothetical protein
MTGSLTDQPCPHQANQLLDRACRVRLIELACLVAGIEDRPAFDCEGGGVPRAD